MVLELKITCACHQAKIAICCQTPLVAPIAPKICTGRFFNIMNPNLPSDLLSDHSRNTSFKTSHLHNKQYTALILFSIWSSSSSFSSASVYNNFTTFLQPIVIQNGCV